MTATLLATRRDPSLADYLAGSLSEDAKHRLELAALESPEVFEALLAEEAELLDAFARDPSAPELQYLGHLVSEDEELQERADLAAVLTTTIDSPQARFLPRPPLPTGARVLGLLGVVFAFSVVFTMTFGSAEPAGSRPLFLVGVAAWFMISSAALLWVRAHRNARAKLTATLEQAQQGLAAGLDIELEKSEAGSTRST